MAGDGYRVGVLGATGAVGSTILRLLAEREFPVAELVPFASERSEGSPVPFAGGEVRCQVPSEQAADGLDLVLASAGGSVSERWAPVFAAAGAIVVDNTSFWRMHDDVPLVIPEVNPDALDGHHGIVANPNCSTMQMVMALAPLHAAVGLERIVVCTYQSVSGTGNRAIAELREQTRAVLDGGTPKADVYPHPIAFNVLPQVERFADGDDYTTEERKMMAETRKILGVTDEHDLPISATCARVPVVTGHSEAVNVRTKQPLSVAQCRDLLAEAPGVLVLDDPADGIYPMATEAAGRDEVLVGRIRRDPGDERTLNMWVVGDNLRKGAATNTVQIAELLHDRNLLGHGAPASVPFA
ncbi:MAG: aspartate-semialdehyde dehydrogenase [Solirubrobacterales bacterium]